MPTNKSLSDPLAFVFPLNPRQTQEEWRVHQVIYSHQVHKRESESILTMPLPFFLPLCIFWVVLIAKWAGRTLTPGLKKRGHLEKIQLFITKGYTKIQLFITKGDTKCKQANGYLILMLINNIKLLLSMIIYTVLPIINHNMN